MSQAAGRARAERLYPVMGTCERCGVVPAEERHHLDANTQNNARSNVAFLCRRCHRAVDGRDELLASVRRATAARRAARPVCAHGHPYTPENTRVDKHGNRHCRTCHREQQRERRAR